MSNRVPIEITAEVSKLRQDMEGLKGYFEGWGHQVKQSLTNLFTQEIFNGIHAGVSSVVSVLKESIGEATEAAHAQAKLEAVLKATGYAAGFSASEMSGFATQLMALTDIDDDVIKNAEAIIATFREIKGDTFKEATKAALDMSAVLEGDLQGAAIQVGKALNDPTRGITALSKAGVSFTTEQRNLIESLQKTGDVAGAQKIILEELKNEFGGTAEAMAHAAGHGLGHFRLMIANVKEDLGGALLPAIDKLMDTLTAKLKPVLDDVVESFGNWAASISDGDINSFTDAVVNLTSTFGDLAKSLQTSFLPLCEQLLEEVKAIIALLPNSGAATADARNQVSSMTADQRKAVSDAFRVMDRGDSFFATSGGFGAARTMLGKAGIAVDSKQSLLDLMAAIEERTDKIARKISGQHQTSGFAEGDVAREERERKQQARDARNRSSFPLPEASLDAMFASPRDQTSKLLSMFGIDPTAALSAGDRANSRDPKMEAIVRQAVQADMQARQGQHDRGGFSASVESAEALIHRMTAGAASREPAAERSVTLQERSLKIQQDKVKEDKEVTATLKKIEANTKNAGGMAA